MGKCYQKLTLCRVLTYHSIGIENTPLTVSQDLFDVHMSYIKNNYNPISINELVSCIYDGVELPVNAVLVTFDDGYQDNYRNAYPILNKYNIYALIFLATGFIGSKMPLYNKMLPMLTWGEVAELNSTGLIHFGSHTSTHIRLSEVPSEIAKSTVIDSKNDIEKRIGLEVNSFCYPQNRFNKSIINIIKDAGFKIAFGGAGFVNKFYNPFKIRRLQIEYGTTLETIINLLERDSNFASNLYNDILK